MSENDFHYYHVHLREAYNDDQIGSGRTRKPSFTFPIIIKESAALGTTDDEDKRQTILRNFADAVGVGFVNGIDADISYPGLIQISIEKIYNEYTHTHDDGISWTFGTNDPLFSVGELPAGQRVTSPYPRRVCIYEDSQGSIVLSLDTVEPVDNEPDIKAAEDSCVPILKEVGILNDPLVKLSSRLFDSIVVEAKQNEYIATR